METCVLLIENNAPRYNERRDGLVAAGVAVISAVEVARAAEALKSNRVDVVCINSRFVTNCESGIGAIIEGLKPAVSVVMVGDEAKFPIISKSMSTSLLTVLISTKLPMADARAESRQAYVISAMVRRLGEPWM